jgi:hypothetical protein
VTRRGALRLVALAGIVLALAGLGLTAWDHRIELTATAVSLSRRDLERLIRIAAGR